MSQALLPRGCDLVLLLRVHGLRRLSSHAAGAERWRGHPRQQQEENKAVKVSVWWDFQKCQLPPGANPCRVASHVTAALRAAGIRGPVEITVFGDVFLIPRAVQEVLAATGVAFSHVPSSGKDGSDRSFMADLVYWIAQNPPPSHFFLISGDKDFANILHRLRMSNYNILLSCPNTDSSVLCSAATIMWPWEALVKGVGLLPKHFNQPPNGLSFSWYGHYKGALDDPFLKTESEDSMALPLHAKKPEKPPVVPKYVVNGVREALDSYPGGVNLQDLQSELKRRLLVDKGLFGFKIFISLLHAMPDVVKFIDPLPGDSQPAVARAYKKSEEPGEQIIKRKNSAQRNGEVKRPIEIKNEKLPSSDLPSSPAHISSTVQKKIPTFVAPSFPSDSLSRDHRKAPSTQAKSPAFHMEAGMVTASGESRTKIKEVSLASEGGLEPIEAHPVESPLVTATGTPSSGVQGISSKKRVFERIWNLWNGPEPVKPEVYPSHDATCSKGSDGVTSQEGNNIDRYNRYFETISKDVPRSDNPCGQDVGSNSKVSTRLWNIPSSNHSEKINLENIANSNNHSDKSVDIGKAEQIESFGENSKGIFSWAARWWSSGKSDTRDNRISTDVIDDTRKDSGKGSAHVKTADSASGHQVGVELFEKPYFWDALEQYLLSPHGLELVSEAKTREELARGLQKQSCCPLRGLDEKCVHQLVHLLVSEKKWIEESISETYHFVLRLPQRGTCAPVYSSKSDGLSHLFTNGRPLEQCKSVHGRSTTPSRQPFQNLPARNGTGQTSYKGNENQSHGDDFAWEELDPVSSNGDPHQEIDKGVRYHPPTLSDDESSDDENHAAGKLAEKDPDDELADDQNHAAGQQAGRDATESSLLKILASWNGSKDGGSSKNASRNTGNDGGSSKKHHGVERLVDCSRTDGHYRQRWRPTAKHQL